MSVKNTILKILGIDGSNLVENVVLQTETTECALACIAMICKMSGRNEGLIELRRRFPVSMMGTGLKSFISMADSLGFTARAVRCELDELANLQVPCVLHWDLDHYVVLGKCLGDEIIILDPAVGMRRLSLSEVSRHFTGVALEFSTAPHFEKKKVAEKVRLQDLWSRLSGFLPVIIQIFFLTILLQAFGLIMPIANQMVIDDVIGHGDKELLVAVIVGFGLIALIQSAIDLLRNFIQLHVGQKLSLQLSGNLLKHLLRLPIDFFERRHVGDILGRFGSLSPVQTFLTGGIIGIIMDAVMVVPATFIMLKYSLYLSGLVIANLLIVVTVQFLTFSKSRQYSDESITLSSKTQSVFLETIRAVRAIKLAGRESERHAIWQNSMTDQQNLSFKQATFNLWGGGGFGLLMAAQGLLMLYLGATEIIDGKMTLGMFMAFQSYASQFSSRTKSLVSQFFTFKMLGLHLERLGDIVYADEEEGIEKAPYSLKPIDGGIELKNLDFRYNENDPWILKNINLKIEPGDRVAFIGPSGAGKSTLLKILTGLYLPIDGDVIIDGVSLRSFGVKAYRKQIGVVMQDDQLLSGTIADNVAFFDAFIDMPRVEEVCRIAKIHNEILRLPMGYHSLIGDMGSVLSGGQKQRVLLARALYNRPRILFMDEGTANLDAALENSILNELKALEITQIVVAHRQAAIDSSDRSYRVANMGVTALSLPKVPEMTGVVA